MGDRSGIFSVACPDCARRLMARAQPGAARRAMAAHLAATGSPEIAAKAQAWLDEAMGATDGGG
jgi:hypothetical protein